MKTVVMWVVLMVAVKVDQMVLKGYWMVVVKVVDLVGLWDVQMVVEMVD